MNLLSLMVPLLVDGPGDIHRWVGYRLELALAVLIIVKLIMVIYVILIARKQKKKQGFVQRDTCVFLLAYIAGTFTAFFILVILSVLSRV